MDVPTVMDPRTPDRLEALLTRAFDGEATDEERDELASLAAEPRMRALAELRDAVRAALAVPGPVDLAESVMNALDADAAWGPFGADLADAVRAAESGAPMIDLVDSVMAAVEADAAWASVGSSLAEALRAPAIDIADLVMAGIDQDAAWAPLGASVREAVAAPPIDIADLVMGTVGPDAELSAYFDGELASDRTSAVATRLLRDAGARDQLATFARMGEGLRSATHRGSTHRASDVWPGVADAIGVERDVVHGWERIAAPLREAFAAIPPIDVAGAVMAAVEPVAVRMPRWASLGGPLLGFAMAAALLFAVLPESPPVAPDAEGQLAELVRAAPDLRLATINDAQVEELTAARDVVVQVMQFEEGGPTFILVDDPPSLTGKGSGVPL
jgi:negative regulator of sigma E activity